MYTRGATADVQWKVDKEAPDDLSQDSKEFHTSTNALKLKG